MRAEFRLGEERVATRPREVVVIGAGVVGMATALTLADRGHRVTVIDSAAEAGRGTSFANGAQLSYAYTDALASPTTLAQMPRLFTSTTLSLVIGAVVLGALIVPIRNMMARRGADAVSVD